MGTSNHTRPLVVLGPMGGVAGSAPDQSPLDGPSGFYQGISLLDPRFPFPGARERVGGVLAHYLSAFIALTDAVPSASAATPVNIAAAQNTVSGTAMALAGPSVGISTAIPFIPLSVASNNGAPNYGYGGVATIAGLTLDYGFVTLGLTAGSALATLTAAQSMQNAFTPGQQLVIAGAGNAGGTLPLITSIQSISADGRTLTLNSPSLLTNTAAPAGNANILNPFSAAPAIAWVPQVSAGALGELNPMDAVARGVGINCSAAGGGGAFVVRGWDIYGMAMSETITHPGGAVVAYGRKAFKHIASVTPQFTDAGRTYSVGTSDLFGFNIRADKFEFLEVWSAGVLAASTAGFTPADTTFPATSATGDVRGTIQIGNRGPLGAGNGFGSTSPTGTSRLLLAGSLPLYNATQATPTNPAPLYGVTQA